ncbi:hypothetical protein [Stenotrophomonas sp.]|uniref:hypothetical protein n=1 Tax=Stenotrophomonas sp. TaxID=69392 RepID=UPI00289825EA|nr:hypothetical protein [Stenotrophomonas sp.]
MYIEIHQRRGVWARITGSSGWRWRLKTRDGVVLIDARETFDDRQTCLSVVSLLIAGVTAPVMDAETRRLLRPLAGHWVEGEEFIR